MKKVKVLLLGSAFAADLHMDAYARYPELVEIVGVVDKDPARIDRLVSAYNLTNIKRYDDYVAAIADCECDLVDVCLPNFLHADAAVKGLEAGRHVLVEKPLATTVEDAEGVVAASKKAGKHIYYAEDWLFAPAIVRALEVVASGKIGDVKYIRAQESHSGSHSPFAQTIKFCGGGSMVHLGIHPVAFVLSLKNNRWTELVAMTSGGGENNFIHKKMEGEDWGAAIIKFEDNTSAVIEANYVTVGGMEDFLHFYGTQGRVNVDLTFSSPLHVFSEPGLDYTVEKAKVTSGWSRPAVDEKFNLGYVGEIKHFLECCAQDKEPKVGLRGIDGLEALRVINLIYKSAREGVAIKNDRL